MLCDAGGRRTTVRNREAESVEAGHRRSGRRTGPTGGRGSGLPARPGGHAEGLAVGSTRPPRGLRRSARASTERRVLRATDRPLMPGLRFGGRGGGPGGRAARERSEHERGPGGGDLRVRVALAQARSLCHDPGGDATAAASRQRLDRVRGRGLHRLRMEPSRAPLHARGQALGLRVPRAGHRDLAGPHQPCGL